MRNFVALLAFFSLAISGANAQTGSGPKMGKNGGIGSATSTYSVGEPTGGTYAINGTTGDATFNGALHANGDILNPKGSISSAGLINFSLPFPALPTGVAVDTFRYDVGGFSFNDEFGGISNTASAITGTIKIPAGVGYGPYSAAVQGYAQTSEPNRLALGLFGEGGVTGAGMAATGLNTEVMNCQNHSVTNCGIGHGYDFNQIVSAELDTSMYAKAGGVAPTGDSITLLLVKYSDTFTATGYKDSAISILQGLGLPNTSPYKDGLVIEDGAVRDTGITLGSFTRYTSPATKSATLNFRSYTAAGTKIDTPIYVDDTQALRIGRGADGNAPIVATSTYTIMTKPVVLPAYTVATLPACGTAAPAGAMAYVTDATSPTYNGTLTGGGSVKIPVFCASTTWTAH